MRYEVKELTNEEGKVQYEFTHIETREGLDGQDIEVVKGRNVMDKENLEEALMESKNILEQMRAKVTDEKMAELMEEYRKELNAEIELTENQADTLTKMIEAIENI